MRLSEVSVGFALAVTLVIVFVLCALAYAVAPGIQASHMWVNLFTAAPLGSVSAWVQGILANLVFGFVAGWVFASVYNKIATKK